MTTDLVTMLAGIAAPTNAESAAAEVPVSLGFDRRLDDELAADTAPVPAPLDEAAAGWLALAALLAAANGTPIPASATLAPLGAAPDAASAESSTPLARATETPREAVASELSAALEADPASPGRESAAFEVPAARSSANQATPAAALAAAPVTAATSDPVATTASVAPAALAQDVAPVERTSRERPAVRIEAPTASAPETTAAVTAPAAPSRSEDRGAQDGGHTDARTQPPIPDATAAAGSPDGSAAASSAGASAATATAAVAVAAPSAGAAPTVAPPPATPVSVESVPVHVEWLAARGGGTARIELHPPDLGPLEISVSVRGQRVEVVLAAREPEAAALLQGQNRSLEQSLASLDLRMDRFEVRASAGAEPSFRDGFAGSEGAGFSFPRDAGGDASPRGDERTPARGRAGATSDRDVAAPPPAATPRPSGRSGAGAVDLRI